LFSEISCIVILNAELDRAAVLSTVAIPPSWRGYLGHGPQNRKKVVPVEWTLVPPEVF